MFLFSSRPFGKIADNCNWGSCVRWVAHTELPVPSVCWETGKKRVLCTCVYTQQYRFKRQLIVSMCAWAENFLPAKKKLCVVKFLDYDNTITIPYLMYKVLMYRINVSYYNWPVSFYILTLYWLHFKILILRACGYL